MLNGIGLHHTLRAHHLLHLIQHGEVILKQKVQHGPDHNPAVFFFRDDLGPKLRTGSFIRGNVHQLLKTDWFHFNYSSADKFHRTISDNSHSAGKFVFKHNRQRRFQGVILQGTALKSGTGWIGRVIYP